MFYTVLGFIIKRLAFATNIDRPCPAKFFEALVGLSTSITCDLSVRKIARYANYLKVSFTAFCKLPYYIWLVRRQKLPLDKLAVTTLYTILLLCVWSFDQFAIFSI